MKSKFTYLRSTIGRKQLVAFTGLSLSLFLLTHMLANLLIIFSAEAYNLYSYKLISNPLIYVAEAGLVALFVIHIALALRATIENKQARPETYAVSASGKKATSLVQSSMHHQGMIIFIFTIYHLITFKFGTFYETTVDGIVMRDLHKLVVEVFQSPIYVFGYIAAVLILGFHLSHGVSSAVRTLGFNHPKYDAKIRRCGLSFAIVITLGFMSQPFYVYFLR